MKKKTLLVKAAGAALAIVASGAMAQSWPPAKPVTLVVPYTAGGSADAIGR